MSTTPLRKGDCVTFKGHPTYVWGPCPQEIVAYACVSCDVDFPTRDHLAAHVKLSGDHLVGRLCTHGLESPSPRPPAKAAVPEREPGEESDISEESAA